MVNCQEQSATADVQTALDCTDVGWERLDAALVDSAPHQNISLVAPTGSPRITNDPVVDSLLGTVSDYYHCMIDRITTTFCGTVNARPNYFSKIELLKKIRVN